MFEKTIFTGFSPNITARDTRTALRHLIRPGHWYAKDPVHKVEAWLREYHSVNTAVTFDSGRSALLFALRALGIQEGDEVLVQAYTCIVVVNAIRFAGATPVYVDIGHDLNMNPNQIASRITQRTKAIIIQHTFGEPANLDAILPIAKKHDVKVIEDCAHSLGVRYNDRLTGTFGDIGLFSFGSDKVISCVRGGALITNDPLLRERMLAFRESLPRTGRLRLFQHLMHYPFFLLGRALYTFHIGKWLLAGAKRLHLMNRIIDREEKRGHPPEGYPTQFPGALATILLDQLRDLASVQAHRKSIARAYDAALRKDIDRQRMSESGIPLRYTLFVSNVADVHRAAKRQGIILGNWYDTPIAPCDVSAPEATYTKGMCPAAEHYASQSINLPTNRHVDKKQVDRIVQLIHRICR